MSANDKFRLGYVDYRYGSILSYKNEVLQSVFMNKVSDLEDTPVNDRFIDGMHALPPPMTRNYMPSEHDVEIDYSKFTYGPKQTSADESDSKPSEYASCESDSSVETSTSMPEPVENASKVVYEPKVWTDAPIIEEYESDSDNDSVSNDDPHRDLKDKGIIDSGCSRHMTGNKAHLADYQEFKCCFVAFRGSNGRITSKRKIKTGRLDFEDVYFMEELKHYNLFFVSQMCDNKNKVLFTDTDCLVLSLDFKLRDKNQVLLKIPRQQNMYSFNLKSIDHSGDLDCLFAKASIDESNKWHKRLGHVNFKNLNKLVKGNLVRGLPFKIFENDHTCVACQKEKQHKASWIKREYSNARTPQQNRVAERKNMTFIESARTMLADSFLPITFWTEAVNTACYVFNRFDGKSNSGFLVGYSLNNKAFRVYNLETKRVEENLHVNFLESKPNVTRKGHAWMFDLDYLTNSMNYKPVLVENQANKSASPKEANNSAGIEANDDQGANSEEIDLNKEHFVLPIWSAYSTTVKSSGDKIEKNTGFKTCEKPNASTSSTNLINTASTPLSTAGPSRAFNDGELSYPNPSKYTLLDDPSMPYLEDIYASPSEGIFTDSSYDDEDVITDFNNLETSKSHNKNTHHSSQNSNS
nr:ribonuclease H-like domain-containing protein [Tanacetum cinerariifolium]